MKLEESKLDPELRQRLNELDTQKQTVGHRNFDAEPTAAEIPEGGFVLADDAGTKYIYTKIGVSNRARASLYAVSHGLMLEPPNMG